MERHTMVMVRSGILAVGLSFLMYWIAASSTLFIIPLLFFAPKFPSNRWAMVPVGVVAALLLGSQVMGYGGVLREVTVIGSLLVGLYVPISLLVGAALWIGLRDRRLLVRFLAASVWAALFGFALLFWLSGTSASAKATEEMYRQVVKAVLPGLTGGQLPLGMDADSLFDAVAKVLRLGFLPLFLGQFGLSAMISELLIHRAEWSFQDRMTRWGLPEHAVWVFLGSWTGVLATMVVDLPMLQSIVWNIALSTSLLYMVQGMSILAALVRRRNPGATATRIFLLSFVLVMLPGVNVIPLAALPLLGVSETWIRYRKNE
jgi:hypothetical protein